jgi:hypothetical protein
MKVVSAVASILMLSASTLWAQNSAARPAGISPSAGLGMPSRSENPMARVQTDLALKRMQETEDTLQKMHALLKEMNAKPAAGNSKDSFAKADLAMWELLLGHLDTQFEQARSAALMQKDIAARRAALYKQAETKAAREAEAAGATQSVPADIGAHQSTETRSTSGSSTPK